MFTYAQRSGETSTFFFQGQRVTKPCWWINYTVVTFADVSQKQLGLIDVNPISLTDGANGV